MNNINRRGLLFGGAAAISMAGINTSALAAATAGLDAQQFGVKPGAPGDQTQALQRAIDAAAAAQTPLILVPGTYRASRLILKPFSKIKGIRGATRLIAPRPGPVLLGEGVSHVALSGLIVDGQDHMLERNAALIRLIDGLNISITECDIIRAGGNGLYLEGISGSIANNTISNILAAAIFSLNAKGLSITGNTVSDCADNGILIWTSEPKPDGTRVSGNHIARIGNKSGGSGEYGNGVNVFRAGNVIVSDNRIEECSYTAVRGNAASNIHIVNNACSNLGEVAIYAEFGFEGALIHANSIIKAASGISVTNFNEGGRLATVSGNLVRDLFTRGDPATDTEARGIGIYAEADTLVSDNVIEGAPVAGIALGWGRYLRDVSVTSNIIRNSAIGIAPSVSQDAGAALIVNNLISGASIGAIIGRDHLKNVTGDLAIAGADKYPRLKISGNFVH